MKPPCLCTGRVDIHCDGTSCDLAGLGRDQCGVCHRYLTDPQYRALWGTHSNGEVRQRPCAHRGKVKGLAECASCGDKTRLKVFSCVRHGSCTLVTPVEDYACCAGCSDYEPETFSLVAPRGTADTTYPWEGRHQRKPWDYKVTACIPHLGTAEPLALVLETLRRQTERPYLIVIDTGSDPATCRQLETMRADDCEIHYIRGHAYINSSAPVTVAMDLAVALCRSEYLYTTHTDVFLINRGYLAWLLSQCGPGCPAVGYEMSSRSWATDQWRGMVSHTASLFHVPTLRRHGACWNMEYAYKLAGWTGKPALGWPDTETGFNLVLRKAGILPRIIGPEENFKLHRDSNLIHVRSFPGTKIYSGAEAYHTRAAEWMKDTMREVRALLRQWDERDRTSATTVGASSLQAPGV
jgi:hypothetical protein